MDTPPNTNPAGSTGIYLEEIFKMTGETHKNFYLSFVIIIGESTKYFNPTIREQCMQVTVRVYCRMPESH